MNIAVLSGGISTERNVSLSSGSLVCRALRERGHNAAVVDAFMGLEGYTGSMEDYFKNYETELHVVSTEVPDIPKIRASRKIGARGYFGERVLEACSYADVVFIALHGGEGENGQVQAALDLMGIKYTGTGHIGSALAMDKDLTKKLLSAAGLPVPAGLTLELRNADFYELSRSIKLPCVIKPVSGGSSIGVSIVTSREELPAALAECAKYDDYAIAEDYIKGRELTIGVLNGRALPPVEIIPGSGFYDYKNKYQAGLTLEVCPAEITEFQLRSLSELAVKVHKALRLGSYSRMEFIMTPDDKFYCLEANTLPGMTPTSLLPQEAAAIGMSYGELCEALVEAALR